ncbi:MAG: leucine-rich repeat protein, partial [Clostridia bacterium]
ILIKYKDSYGAETVNIPSYITKIGKNAMMNTQAKQIVFEGNNVIEIGDYAFKNTKLTSFILPNSVLKLGVGVFANCVDLLIFDGSNSNASITKLPNEFFANSDVNVSNGLLSNLETVTLGNNFKELGIDNFKNCGKLKNITANGICISTDIYLSEIKSTPWANPTVTVGDQHIIIGSVYLKYLQGTEPNRGADNLIIVEVPKGITIIYQKAFFNNNQIGQVVLPKTLVDIKGEAFKDCVKLYKVSITGIAIPAEIPVVETCVLSTIDVSAFENTALNEIIFPQTLITIGDKAFKSTKLVNVTIPNSVTSIGMEAFASIDELEVLTIGKGITIIGNRAFADNDSLSKVNWTLEKATVKISNEDKITIKQFDNIDKSLADVTNYTNDKGIYINNLFVRDGGIKVRIYVSNDAYSIIEVSDLVYINNWTGAISSFGFYKEGEMPQISFDGEGYIMDAYNKEVINNAAELGVPTRADHTFMGWYEDETYINPLIYPYKINSDITIYAKWYTNNWDTDHNPADELVYSVNNNQYTIIGWDAVASTTLFIPNKVNNIAVKEIAIDAANKAKASTVTKIIFTQASNFTDLDTNIFIDFVNLEEVVLCDSNTNNVAYKVVNGALYSTDNTVLIAYFKQYNIDAENIKTLVTTFSIPKNTQFIMPYAFYNSGLTTISIPSTVTDIGKNAFSNNTTTITFDKDIKLVNVDKSSFNNTIWYTQSAYKYYTVNSSNLGTFYAAANVLLEYHEVAAPSLLTLPSSMNEFVITVLASNMYTRLNDNYSRDAYSNVILPDKLERINSEAFALKDAPSDGQIHWLDSESFDGSKCSATLTYIANDVFSKTKYYTEYHNVDLLILGKVLLRYLNTASTLNLVNEKIQTIAKGAFKASKIVSIILPSTLLVIGDEAFSSCDKLTSIEIPSNVTKIGERAFLNCQALVTITYAGEKLVSMGSQIFSGCYHIKNMMIPYSVTEIGVGAFESCTDLERIYFDKPVYALNTETNEMVLSGWSTKSKLATLGAQAFEKCSSLTDIAIPNGLAKISESTFKDCSDLINVVFETDKSMVKLIEIEAFYNCGKLGSIIDVSNPTLITLELPNRLTTVQDNAFYGCTGLYGVLFNYNIASIGNNVFGACRNLAKIEISAANAPSITNNTFLRKYTVDVTPIDPYYALRIYVGDDTDIYSDYTSDWAAANSGDNAFTLCKKSDPKPSLIYSYRKETGGETLTGSFEVPVNMRKDVYINPTYTFYSTSVKEWKFVNVAGGVDDSRIGKTLGNATTLPYTRQYNPNTAIYDYILIMDHDIKLGNVEE